MVHLRRVIPVLGSGRPVSSSSGGGGLLRIGDSLEVSRRFSDSDVAAYAAVTGDANPIHRDADSARAAGFVGGGAVVHGMLVASLFPKIIASRFPGAIYASQTLQFRSPVFVGDAVLARVTAVDLRENKKRYIVKFSTRCFTGSGENLVVDGDAVAVLPTLTLSESQTM
ncbi:hypothetical protein QJS10_CPB21g00344 [Acorus calamus]|uniref:MaoC-like domain-containing protein n=1 Tax=Acorus calamus TaxID=4465 RepID=A0AAV9C7R2_ACOCL|nr:hypothetical protein QJS10_CPB21g00344 [Acorus calamus]